MRAVSCPLDGGTWFRVDTGLELNYSGLSHPHRSVIRVSTCTIIRSALQPLRLSGNLHQFTPSCFLTWSQTVPTKDYLRQPQASCTVCREVAIKSSRGKLAGDVLRWLRCISGSENAEKRKACGTVNKTRATFGIVNRDRTHTVPAIRNTPMQLQLSFPPTSSQSTWVVLY